MDWVKLTCLEDRERLTGPKLEEWTERQFEDRSKSRSATTTCASTLWTSLGKMLAGRGTFMPTMLVLFLVGPVVLAQETQLAQPPQPDATKAAADKAVPPSGAQSKPRSLQEQCNSLSAKDLLADAQKARTPTSIESKLNVLPGGQIVKLQLLAPPENEFYCAKFVEDGLSAPITEHKVSQDDQKTTELTLNLPNIGFGWQQSRQLVVVSFPRTNDILDIASPGAYATQRFAVSNGLFCLLVSLTVVVLAYAAAVLALGRVGASYSLNPVYLTSDSRDKASLSQFQIFGFTLIVLWLLTFIVLRTGLLSDISQDVLLLLGISAGGAVGGKVADQMKKHISYENWSWLRNREWLTAYETGLGQAPDLKRARWSDLLKVNGDFDIYSFQLAVFSIVVAYALVTSGVDQLATFAIPANLKGLLGLSNVVYIGGKAITPNSVGQLDSKVTDLRNAELVWLGQVINSVKSVQDPTAKLGAAMSAGPEKYQAYIGLAREAARMLKALYGAEGTKFKSEPIADSDLMPIFP